MALKEKLEKLKMLQNLKKEPDWVAYKDSWKNAIQELQNTIIYDWFKEYEADGLMAFSLEPVKRVEPFIGEYITSILEITLSENKFIVLEPVSGVTTEYDGKLELYLRGNVYNKVNILRKINSKDQFEWIVARSYDQKDHFKLDKQLLEKIIDEWLQ